MPVKTFLFLLFLLFQLTDISAQQPYYRNYSSQHGLPSSEVYDLYQDVKGYLWFTTDHGLARFDGYQFRTFDMLDGMPENSVFYLKSDKQDRIWFNTYMGKLGYIEKDRVFSYKHNDKLLRFYAENKIKYVIFQNYYPQEDGSIFFNIFDEGLFKIDSTGVISQANSASDAGKLKIKIIENRRTIISIPPSRIIESIELTDDNNTSYHDVTHFELKRFSQNFYNAKHNNKGKAYVSAGRTIFLFDGDTLTKTLNLDHLIVRLGIDREENVWIGTLSGGAYVFDSEMNLIKRLLEGESVTGFLQDHEGGIWLTSLNNGIYYFPEINQRIYSKNSGLPDETLTGMVIDKHGTIWFTSKNNTLGRITKDEIKLFSLKLPGEIFIQKLMPDMLKERLLIATNQKLHYFDYKTEKSGTLNAMKNIPDSFNMIGIKTMVQDKINGEIFYGHFSGISNLLPNGSSTINTYFSNTFLERVESIAIGKDTSLWVGTSTGLYQYADKKFNNMGDRFPMLADRITALAFENDSLWIGTRGNGLLLLHNDSLVQITSNDGLVSNSISSILITAQAVLAGTNKGLSVIKRNQDQKISVMRNLTSSSGLNGNEVIAIAQFEDEIYVATSIGISVFDDLYKEKNIKMPVHYTSVTIENKKTDISKLIKIPFKEQNLAIDYFAISYVKQGRHTYRHRLIGLENEWIINQKTTAQYPYLPPGEYTFELEVMNPDGSWNPVKDRLSFLVMKPAWQQWWFLTLAMLSSLLLIIVAFRLGYQIISKRKQMHADVNKYRQEALSNQMNPHFIFNALNTVQRYILENDKLASSKYLTKFAKLMRTMLNNAQKQQISLSQEMEALNLYLDLEAARFKDRFDYSIDCDKMIDPEAVKIPVFLIQPLVENAIWHGLMNSSRHGKLEIRFMRKDDDLLCEISDNGIGRELAAKLNSDSEKKSLGISIIQKRLSLMNLNNKHKTCLTYEDLKDSENNPEGTKAVICFPANFTK